MNKEVPQEVIVVEGKADHQRLLETFGPAVKVIETNGSAINAFILQQIKHAQKQFGVIVFTDPDFPGLRLRRLIEREVPGVLHAYLPQEVTQSKHKGGSLGIEHARPEHIRQALGQVMSLQESSKLERIDMASLVRLKLIGHPEAKALRKQIAEHFHLGPLNGKQLQKKLAQYGIHLEELESFLKEVAKDA